MPIRASWRPSRSRPRACCTASRTSSTTRPACACTSGSSTCCRASGWGAFLSNSGAEALEAAVKLARVATGRPAIVAFRGGFHGRTAQTMALTSSRVTIRGRLRAAAGLRLPHAVPLLLPGPGGPRPGCLHVRLGGAAGAALPADHPADPGGGGRGRAGPGRGRLRGAAAPASCARLREITRQHGILLDRRRGADGLRPDGPDVRRGALGRHARHPDHGQGHRLRPAALRAPRPRAS